MMRRRGPGIVGTVARTAVIAGTATAVSNRVSDRHYNKAAEQQQAQMADQAALSNQQEIEQMQAQMQAMQAQQVAGRGESAGLDSEAASNSLS